MTKAVPQFRFTGRATTYVARLSEGYCYTSLDQVQSLSVLARNNGEALDKALAMLGTHPTSGWTIIWDRVDEESTA